MNDEREKRPRRRAKSSKDVTYKVRNKSQAYVKGHKGKGCKRKKRRKIQENARNNM